MIKVPLDEFDWNNPKLVRDYGLNMHGLLVVLQHCKPFMMAVERNAILESYVACLEPGGMPGMQNVLRRLGDVILPAFNGEGVLTDIIEAINVFRQDVVCDGTFMQIHDGSSTFEDLIEAILGVQTRYAEDLDAKLAEANAWTNKLALAWRTTYDPHPRRARNT